MAFSPHVESVKVDKVLHGALDVKVELKMQKVVHRRDGRSFLISHPGHFRKVSTGGGRICSRNVVTQNTKKWEH